MNAGEFEVMARVEDDHWWYRGLRDMVVRVLATPRAGLPAAPRILDAGCGTGRNLAALRDAFQPSRLVGFDTSSEALAIAAQKAPEAELRRDDICDPKLGESGFDVAVSLDVIYIPGSEKARPGLEAIVRALRPGGLLVLNLPAYNWLYSEHDVAIHTAERYTARRVSQLLDSIGLDVEWLSYRLCGLFPLVVASRLPSLFRARPGDAEARSALHRESGAALNQILYGVLRAENALIVRGTRLPFGSSVFAVGRKP